MPADLKNHIIAEVKKTENVGKVSDYEIAENYLVYFFKLIIFPNTFFFKRKWKFWKQFGFHALVKMLEIRRIFHLETFVTTQPKVFPDISFHTGISQTTKHHFSWSKWLFPHHHVSEQINDYVRNWSNNEIWAKLLMCIWRHSFPGHTLINIECRAWSKNIRYDRQNRLGSVHFEILVD